MISFDKLWELTKSRGITKYKLINSYGIDDHTIQRLRKNQPVKTITVNKLCEILNCRVEDIMEYKPDDPPIFDELLLNDLIRHT